ncbi:Hydrazine synthase subunit gamma [Halioglobus japonicus]|nr:Hydrazine synthase subunit gamma [Halioglobus japonicus]
MNTRFLLATALFGALSLSACSGGGNGDNASDDGTTPAPPAPPTDPSTTITPDNYVLFESGQVRPLAFSSDGTQIFVANTPAGQLDIVGLEGDQLQLIDSVSVGLEPVAVAARDDSEVWVVNHLSDSVSIVDVGAQPHVRQTLLVGDEPRDIVFAGEEHNLAFITAAYRGQNHPTFDPEHLTAPGLGRADVWVYDSDNLVNTDVNGGPLTILNLFTDSLRSLAALPDGSRVYAASFMSGNQTTTVDASVVIGNKPEPQRNRDGIQAPNTGLIVQQSDGRWLDEDGVDWSPQVNFNLPDYDVFEIDTSTALPELRRQVSGVGTGLFNIVVNATRGELYVSNLEARNQVRFEGPGLNASTVRGHIADTRISVVTNDGVSHVDMNPHVDFSRPEGAAVPAAEAQKSLSQITAMVLSADGNTLYAAALGSNKIAFIDTVELNQAGFTPDAADHLLLPGGGPSGLALSPDGKWLVVYTRYDNSLVVVDTQERRIVSTLALYNPEPQEIVNGRKFLYDAALTSANGVNACSSCHWFADNDALAWDLGNPDASMQRNTNPFVDNSPIMTSQFHPMKGPMTTQTLRGIADSGPQHWRGDRTGENPASVNGATESVAAAAFKEFNPAFVGLVGRHEELSEEEMQQFTDFALALTPPPNPIRNLDNSLTPEQQAGRDIYFDVGNITGIGSCNHCHELDPAAKKFGSGGKMSFEGGRIAEDFKVPHLRNAYAKIGMFGGSSPNAVPPTNPPIPTDPPIDEPCELICVAVQECELQLVSQTTTTGPCGPCEEAVQCLDAEVDENFMGDQVRGFGFLHDGAIDTLDTFFKDPVFNFPRPADESRANVVRFTLVMDSNLLPIVGQQVTLRGDSPWTFERLALLEESALANSPRPQCQLLGAGVIDGERKVLRLTGANSYEDSQGVAYTGTALRESARAAGQELTFTCYPPA